MRASVQLRLRWLVLAAILATTVNFMAAVPAGAQDPATEPTLKTQDWPPFGLPKENPISGLLYNGLRLPESPVCQGSVFEIVTLLLGPLCTHGPDPAPPYIDVRTDQPGNAPVDDTAPTKPIACGGTDSNRVMVVYARAADQPDRYDQFVHKFRVWAAAVDQIFANSSNYGRTVRWVTNANCEFTIPKVTLLSNADDSFANTIHGLSTSGYALPGRKYLVFMDANLLCGVATHYQDDSPGQANMNNGDGAQYARIDRGCWGTYAAAHELMHTLGAVQPGAPNATAYGHCNDGNDIMCYFDGQGTVVRDVCLPADQFAMQYDCNNDDYFAPTPMPGSWLASHWNTYNSRFLTQPTTPPPPPTATDLWLFPSSGSLTANWASTANPGTGWRVTATPANGDEPTTFTVSPGKRSAQIAGLTNGVAYDVRVRGVTGAAQSNPISVPIGVPGALAVPAAGTSGPALLHETTKVSSDEPAHDITVTITGLYHTCGSEMSISLVPPTGDPIALYNPPSSCTPYGPVNVVFRDDATTSASSPMATGTRKPVTALSTVTGPNLNGRWSIRFTDANGIGTGGYTAASVNFTGPPPTKDPWAPHPSAAAAVTAAYQDMLGRPPTGSGPAWWEAELASGRRSQARMLDEMAGSPEWTNMRGPVLRLYLAAFRRLPDRGGFAFYSELLRLQKRSKETIAENFLTSPEWNRLWGDTSDDATFVSIILDNLGDDDITPADLAPHLATLHSGVPRSVWLVSMVESETFKTELRPYFDVFSVWVQTLNRNPADPLIIVRLERDIPRVINNEVTREQLFAEALNDPLYRTAHGLP